MDTPNATLKGIFLESDYGQNIKLDTKDKKILSILGDNCRIPTTAIAESIHSSKGSVSYRIKELVKKDVYRKNITIINPFILGFPVYVVLLKLKNINPHEENNIIKFFGNHPFIIWVGKTQGNYDFNISMTAKSINHFDRLLKDIYAKLGESLKEAKVLHITKLYGCDSFPLQLQKELNIKTVIKRRDSSFSFLLKRPYCDNQKGKIKLTTKELLILKEIADKAILSLQGVSERTGIKPDTVRNTIKEMIRKEVILAFRGIMNVSFLRFHGYVVYFRLSPKVKEKRREEFEEFFKNSDFTAFGTEASGSYYDSIIYLFAKNPLEFNGLIRNVRGRFSDIIDEYATDLILKDFKLTFLPEGLTSSLKP